MESGQAQFVCDVCVLQTKKYVEYYILMESRAMHIIVMGIGCLLVQGGIPNMIWTFIDTLRDLCIAINLLFGLLW